MTLSFIFTILNKTQHEIVNNACLQEFIVYTLIHPLALIGSHKTSASTDVTYYAKYEKRLRCHSAVKPAIIIMRLAILLDRCRINGPTLRQNG